MKSNREEEMERILKEIVAFNDGKGLYDLSHLDDFQRQNATHDLWGEIRTQINEILVINT